MHDTLKLLTILGHKDLDIEKKDTSYIFSNDQIPLMSLYKVVNEADNVDVIKIFNENYEELVKWYNSVDFDEVKEELKERIPSKTLKRIFKKSNKSKQYEDLEDMFGKKVILGRMGDFLIGNLENKQLKNTNFSKNWSYNTTGLCTYDRKDYIVHSDAIEFLSDLILQGEFTDKYKLGAKQKVEKLGREKFIDTQIALAEHHEKRHLYLYQKEDATPHEIILLGNHQRGEVDAEISALRAAITNSSEQEAQAHLESSRAYHLMSLDPDFLTCRKAQQQTSSSISHILLHSLITPNINALDKTYKEFMTATRIKNEKNFNGYLKSVKNEIDAAYSH